jgi:hypothetical protein
MLEDLIAERIAIDSYATSSPTSAMTIQPRAE